MAVSLRQHLCAAFVALHLFAVGAAAIPSPKGGVDASSLRTEQARQQVEFVADAVGALGMDADADVVSGELWAIGAGLRRVRTLATAPFEPYFRYAGTTQSWRMFSSVSHSPRQFTVDVDAGGGWQTVYAMADPEHRWRADTFEHERVRAVLADFQGKPRKSYIGFARRVATWAHADFPESRAIRTRLVQRRTPKSSGPPGPPRDFQTMIFACSETGCVVESGPTDPK